MALPGYGRYDDFDTDVPPEISAEQQRIAKQQQIAEAMLQRGMAPLPTNQGPLHWTQALAQVLNARQGRVDLDAAEKARSGLADKYQRGVADEIQRVTAMRQGRPTQVEPAEYGEVVTDRGEAPNPRGAIEQAMLSQYAPVRRFGELQHRTYEAEQTRAADRASRLEERALALEARAAEQALSREERERARQEAAALRRELANQADETRRLIAGQKVSVTVPPPITAVTIADPNDPNKTIVVDGRSGRVIGAGPKLTEAGKLENKRQFNMQGIGSTIQQAEDLLSGTVRREDGTVDPTKNATKPTGSGVGTVVDKALGIFGASTGSADMAAKLKTVGGALVSKMPRMEGPQSDRDVALYKEMAGMIGDSTVPIPQRQAALEEVKRIWAKYERLNPDAFAGGAAAPAAPPGPTKPAPAPGAPARIASDAEFNALPSGALFIGPDGVQRRKP